jgi:transcriptional regulator with XRE-family HTH domain
MSTDFATRLRVIRSERKLKRADVARDAGLSPAVYGRYERGERTPTVDTARAIAEALGVSLDYLTGVTELAVADQRMLARLQEIEQLPTDRRQTLIDVMDAFLRDFKAARAYAT